MEGDEKTPFDLLREMSKDLGLDYEEADSQDWGVIYADANKLKEFIDYYQHRISDLVPTQKLHLVDLIFASANEALIERKPLVLDDFTNFVQSFAHEFEFQLSSWMRYPEDEEFPIAKLLLQLRNGD